MGVVMGMDQAREPGGSRRPRAPAIDAADGLIALALGLAGMALYVRTLVTGLLPGDGGEFQTLAYTMGHAHAPGYGVQVLLSRLFVQLVRVADVAHRVSLLSAVAGALTLAFVYCATRVLARSRLAGVVAAFALAISATFWSQAIIAEVYTPGCAFTSAILLLVLLWQETRQGRLLFAAGLLGGSAIGVHTSNALYAPAIVVLVLLCHERAGRGWRPAVAGAGLGLALMLGAFAWIDATPTPSSTIHSVYQPSMSRWDQAPGDLDTARGRFAFLFFARQWRSAMFAGDPHEVTANALSLRRSLRHDFAVPILLLVPLGLIALALRRWRLAVFFVVAIATHLAYVLQYHTPDIYVFLPSLYVYLCPLIGEGLATLLRALARRRGAPSANLRPALAAVFLVLAAAPFYESRAAALRQGELRFDFMGLMSNQQLRERRVAIEDEVKHLPARAIVLTDWDRLYGYYYVAEVEQGRNDLLFIEALPFAARHGMARSLVAFLRDSVRSGRPLYADRRFDELLRGGFAYREVRLGSKRTFRLDAP
jgi:hypothetical protein